MNPVDQMVEILKELKTRYAATGIKGEFEDEGMTIRDAELLKTLSSRCALPLSIKIGGCGAVSDMCEANRLQCEKVIAPMIESPFALKKFLGFIKKFYPAPTSGGRKIMINIETQTACRNFEEMLRDNDIEMLDGIVIGRGDLALSMGLERNDINSPTVYEAVLNVCETAKEHNLYCIIGGNMNTDSIVFLKKLGPDLVDEYETRKISFSAKALYEPNCAEGILKSLQFEVAWLMQKSNGNSQIADADVKRIEKLKNLLRAQKKAEICKS